MYAHLAAPWSSSSIGSDRTPHHQRTKQRGQERQPPVFCGGEHGTVGEAEDGTRASRGEIGGERRERSRDSEGVDGEIGGESYERAAVLVHEAFALWSVFSV
jgi:hypothetical protein